jgi:quercetin dioxygenase-like cupin family protein
MLHMHHIVNPGPTERALFSMVLTAEHCRWCRVFMLDGPSGVERTNVTAASNPSDLYSARRRVRHIERPDFRLTELELTAGQTIPWHKHTSIRDTFYVLEGVVRVTLLDPAHEVEVRPGETFAVKVGRPHLVANAGTAAATFLVLQGVGDCDFVPIVDRTTHD